MVNDVDMDDDKDRESIPMMKTGKWIYCLSYLLYDNVF